jgi:hypothetical protein
VSLQRKKDNAEYSMNALSERARNLFVNRRKALFPLFHGISCLKKLTRREEKQREKSKENSHTLIACWGKLHGNASLLCGIFRKREKGNLKWMFSGCWIMKETFRNGWSVFAASLSVWSGDYAEICEAFFGKGKLFMELGGGKLCKRMKI